MASYYCIVQYSPDPVRDERINVGVIAFGGGRVRSHFLQNWNRVARFGSERTKFIRDFARDADSMSEDNVRRIAGRWINSIQFTKPAASLLDVDDILYDAAKRFLVDENPAQRGYRGRNQARIFAVNQVKTALHTRLGGLSRFYHHENYAIQGIRSSHHFDVAVGNGHIAFVVQGLSFERPLDRSLEQQVDATAWAVSDITAQQDSPNIGIFVFEPKNDANRDFYGRSVRTFEDVGASVIDERNATGWTTKMVEQVKAEGFLSDQSN
jgi:hypothetical protein